MSTKLEEAFENVLNHFNAAEYDKLLPMMDGDVIMKKVDDPGSVVGIGNVINYLNGRQKLFKPKLDVVNRDYRCQEFSDTVGQVSGIGKMHDKTVGEGAKKAPVPVQFTFTFTRANKEETWVVINAFAARTI